MRRLRSPAIWLSFSLSSVLGCAPEPAPVAVAPAPSATPQVASSSAPPLDPEPVAVPLATTPVASASASAAPIDAPLGSATGAVPAAPLFAGKVSGRPARPLPPSPDDPLKGVFSFADATKDLPKSGVLVADIRTTAGDITCRLLDREAPKTVANFVGLARGLRPFRDPKTETWVKRPAYDGTVFHRVIPGFMIQGGDPTGTGTGEPGYVVPDEVWAHATHDRAGLLCMANRGADTNGAQFFITDGAALHLDNGFTIFGVCEPLTVVHDIASRPLRSPDRPADPVRIRTIGIRRVPGP